MSNWNRLNDLSKELQVKVLENLTEVSEHELEEMFDEMLDDCYEPIKICGYEYAPSTALFRVDEIAYREAFSSYTNGPGSDWVEWEGSYYREDELSDALDDIENDPEALKDSRFEYLLVAEPEDATIEGNCSASGDDEWDKKIHDRIIEQLQYGNMWAWCSVTLLCRYTYPNGAVLETTDHLGCCSYESREDFEACDYYRDMIQNTTDEMNELIGKGDK